MRVTVKLTEKGQSLLEVAIALGIGMIIITALTVVTLEGLRNSQFSENLTQSTGYATEGRDIARTMRDRNSPVYYSASASYSWADFFNTYISCNGAVGRCDFALGVVSGGATPTCTVNGSTQLNASNACLLYIGTSGTPEYLLSKKFTRLVNIIDCSKLVGDSSCPSGKKVTVTVYWNDATGKHNSNLVTILADL